LDKKDLDEEEKGSRRRRATTKKEERGRLIEQYDLRSG